MSASIAARARQITNPLRSRVTPAGSGAQLLPLLQFFQFLPERRQARDRRAVGS